MSRHQVDATGDDLRDLAETLVREYAGAVPAHSVVRAVYRAARSMRRGGLDGQPLAARAEQSARRERTDLIAKTLRP